MRIVLFGHRGKVGRVVESALSVHGHEVVGLGRHDPPKVAGADVGVDFTRPDTVVENVCACIDEGVPCVIGTTAFDREAVDAYARERGVPCFHAPNFSIGAVLMMRFAAEASHQLPRAEIIELHHESKVDAPSGTARATAELLPGNVPIHSVRLPGLVAHQEVILATEGQTLTIRHDTYTREAFVPGVLLALDRIRSLPPGLTVGLDAFLA